MGLMYSRGTEAVAQTARKTGHRHAVTTPKPPRTSFRRRWQSALKLSISTLRRTFCSASRAPRVQLGKQGQNMETLKGHAIARPVVARLIARPARAGGTGAATGGTGSRQAMDEGGVSGVRGPPNPCAGRLLLDAKRPDTHLPSRAPRPFCCSLRPGTRAVWSAACHLMKRPGNETGGVSGGNCSADKERFAAVRRTHHGLLFEQVHLKLLVTVHKKRKSQSQGRANTTAGQGGRVRRGDLPHGFNLGENVLPVRRGAR